MGYVFRAVIHNDAALNFELLKLKTGDSLF